MRTSSISTSPMPKATQFLSSISSACLQCTSSAEWVSDAMAASRIGSFVLKNLVERAVKELHVKHIAAYARVSGMSFP